VLASGLPAVASVFPSAKFSPWLKPLLTAPMNTHRTAVAQRFLIKSFSHMNFWESRFDAPLYFQWKAVTHQPHAPKLCQACLDQNSCWHARYLVNNCQVFQSGL